MYTFDLDLSFFNIVNYIGYFPLHTKISTKFSLL